MVCSLLIIRETVPLCTKNMFMKLLIVLHLKRYQLIQVSSPASKPSIRYSESIGLPNSTSNICSIIKVLSSTLEGSLDSSQLTAKQLEEILALRPWVS